MLYTIENQHLRVTVSSRGGELQGILRLIDGSEALWQGDPSIWDERAPNLFPICGRLNDQKYRWEGQEYHMSIHGFASSCEMEAVFLEKNALCLRMSENAQTLAQYPFRFTYEVEYRLENNRLVTTYRVTNRGDGVLPFSYGAHPAFRVPMQEGEDFDEYLLEFPVACTPEKLVFTEKGLFTGITLPYPLEGGRQILISHAMFDREDSLFFCQMTDSVVLRSKNGGRYVKVSYPGFPYLGFWQMPGKKAGYLCIEPWCGTPSLDGHADDFSAKADMIRLEAGEQHSAVYSMEFGG